jgi:hypothetical protein
MTVSRVSSPTPNSIILMGCPNLIPEIKCDVIVPGTAPLLDAISPTVEPDWNIVHDTSADRLIATFDNGCATRISLIERFLLSDPTFESFVMTFKNSLPNLFILASVRPSTETVPRKHQEINV